MAGLDESLRATLGGKAAAKLDTAFGMATTGDLLRHYPRRYARRGELTDLAALRDGDQVTVFAQVEKVSTRPMRARRGQLLEVTVTDGRARLALTFFNKVQYWERQLTPGRHAMFAGRVSTFKGQRQLAHPEFKLLAADDAAKAAEYAAELIPVYPATKDVSTWDIEKCVQIVLDTLGELDDPLPPPLRERYGLAGLAEALRGIHRPADDAQARSATTRLKWDEALVLQAVLAQRRRAAAALPATARPASAGGLAAAFDARLPFSLTAGQREVGAGIAADLARDHPMHRLLQGEVGSGKTVIAVRAMLQVIDAGGQAALLAPTEVLAQQHYRSVSDLLGPLGQAGRLGGAEVATRVALLTGSQPAAARREALLDAASGAAGIVIGTHALLAEQVQFADLGLVVVDEQHRFGVEQRDALRGKAQGARPHVLVMTATPIPRTVAMTVYGDLDVSTLAELPGGRLPIATHVVPAAEKPRFLDRAWERVREEAEKGRQAYVVCPRIGGDDGAPSSVSADLADPDAFIGPDDEERSRAGRRSPCWTWRPRLSRARWPGCGCGSCTGGCPPTTRTARCGPSPTGRPMCSCRPPWSRWAWTCRTPPSWWSWTPTGSGCPSCTSCAAGWAGAPRRGCACSSPRRPRRARPGSGWPTWPRPWTASGWPRSTWSSAGRVMCWAPPRQGGRRA